MRFIHKTKDNQEDTAIIWTVVIDGKGECDIYANDSLIFTIERNSNIGIKCSGDVWRKIANLIVSEGEITTDYKEE